MNAKNLEALGAGRLAELVIEINTGNAAAKRRLRLELAGALACVFWRADLDAYDLSCARCRGGAEVRQVESAIVSESHVAGRKGQPRQDLFDPVIAGKDQLAGARYGPSWRRRELQHKKIVVAVERQPGYRREARQF